jgi:hypothetical protein
MTVVGCTMSSLTFVLNLSETFSLSVVMIGSVAIIYDLSAEIFFLLFITVCFAGSHSKKMPNNLVLGRTYDDHIYDLIEVGVENYKSIESYAYDKKLAPKLGTKPFFAFIGEHFESVEELKHLKEMLLDHFKGEVCIFYLYDCVCV